MSSITNPVLIVNTGSLNGFTEHHVTVWSFFVVLINRIHYRNNRKAVISQINYCNRAMYMLIYSVDE